MRILFIALGVYSRTGGIEAFNRRVVRCLAEAARQHQCSATVIALWDLPEHAAIAPPHIKFLPGCCSKSRTAFNFLSRALRDRLDVILYGHVLLAPLAAVVRTLNPKAQQVLFVHGTEVWGDAEFRRVPWWEPPLVRSSIHRLVSVSEFTKRRMLSAFRLPPERFRLLPNAVDWEEIPPSCKAKTGTPVILSVSRLGLKDRYKGVDKVILALPEILRSIPGACYWVVGEGPLREDLQQLAVRCGVSGSVKFFGYVDDHTLQQLYSQAQVFVLPSTGEGFGIVFLEAWKHGLPVICGCTDAGAEVVSDGLNGITVDPGDVSALASAAVRLLTDAHLRARLGQNGQNRARTFSHAAFCRRLAEILNELLPQVACLSCENPKTPQSVPSARR